MTRMVSGVFVLSLFLYGAAVAEEVKEKTSTALEQEMKIEELRKRIEALEEKGGSQGEDSNDFRVFWKDGLNLETAGKNFKMKMGGRLENDWIWATEEHDLKDFDDIGDLEDGTEFRRARFFTSGTIYENVEFKLEFDFAEGEADLKDAYIALKDLPFGSIKGGHFKEPFSLEELTSANTIVFMEKGLPNLFAPSRNAGFALYNNHLEENLTWAAGIFRTTDVGGSDVKEGKYAVKDQSEGGYAVTARLTGLPWYEDKGNKLVHLGASTTWRSLEAQGHEEDKVRYNQRPGIHLSPRFVDTGDIPADNIWHSCGEFALVLDSFHLQGEYFVARVKDAEFGEPPEEDDLSFQGYCVEAGYFLTGDRRNYKKADGCFSQPKINHNFMQNGSIGAVQLAARYSFLDLNDSNIEGGELSNITLGLNWYLNPNVRIMLNWVHAMLDERGSVDGDADFFGMRLHVYF